MFNIKKKIVLISGIFVLLFCGCAGEKNPDIVKSSSKPIEDSESESPEDGMEDIYVDGSVYHVDSTIDQDADSTDAKPGTYVNGCYVGRCNLTNLGDLFERGVNIPPARFGSFREEASIWIDENIPEFEGDIYIDLDSITEDGMDTIFFIKSDNTKTKVKVFFSLGEDTFSFEKVK